MKKHAVDELAVQRLRGLNEALLNEQTQRLELQAEVVGKDATISSLLLQLSEKDKQCQEHAVKMEQKDAIIAALYQAVNENEVETNALLESSM
ncbi:hypothetical protein BV25DRAFT_1910959 [Artomyces pyxidatus]|uniref:Uncharacterized protein n=1 Tax=Artomyces pyxidatus TaxID=48021 RepID=A0ACB8TLI8_9AGAM|nr:hypothetical protein BV25DRAFT_1910959 [Artomyces pyxidatus]